MCKICIIIHITVGAAGIYCVLVKAGLVSIVALLSFACSSYLVRKINLFVLCFSGGKKLAQHLICSTISIGCKFNWVY
jgi:hypothetical protein